MLPPQKIHIVGFQPLTCFCNFTLGVPFFATAISHSIEGTVRQFTLLKIVSPNGDIKIFSLSYRMGRESYLGRVLLCNHSEAL